MRDVLIHLVNEQLLVADLPTMPSRGDVTLHCTNLRTLDRKRPDFVDQVASTFIIPFAQIRLVEIPGDAPRAAQAAPAPASAAAEPGEIQLDEDLLRRVREL
jgi:hypothetical protein